jgi:hypothetical protein
MKGLAEVLNPRIKRKKGKKAREISPLQVEINVTVTF